MSCGTRARGAVTGLVAAAGAAWGHLWAGGLVTPAALVTATALSVLVGAALTRPDRLSPPRLVLATGLVQVLWHVLFTTSSPPAAQHAMAHGTGPDTAMLAVHVLAGVLALAVAAGADTALLGLARALLDRLRVPAPVATCHHTHPTPVPAPRVVRPAGGEQRVEGARGPPRVRNATDLAAVSLARIVSTSPA